VTNLTNRELVISALLRGKEQRLNYLLKSLDGTGPDIYGKMAVLFRQGVFLVVIRERKPFTVLYQPEEYHADERYTLPDLAAVEHLMATRLRTRLAELRPSKGMRLFSKQQFG
jgi:hypothetical protein